MERRNIFGKKRKNTNISISNKITIEIFIKTVHWQKQLDDRFKKRCNNMKILT